MVLDARRETVTRLLAEVREGRSGSFDRLFPVVYNELHGLARRARGGWRGGETLNTTALVHEAYLKLVDQTKPDWRSRGHFGAVAAKAMRHILIDYARRRSAAKRGGDRPAASLDEALGVASLSSEWSADDAARLIALDEALERLERESERGARIVELKLFGGLTNEETAEALGISLATVKRGWSLARARLYRELVPTS
jgi:RNA polymerase sigma factor (TIGR02999 family)